MTGNALNGLSGIYLNLAGRERNDIVQAQNAETPFAGIKNGLPGDTQPRFDQSVLPHQKGTLASGGRVPGTRDGLAIPTAYLAASPNTTTND